MKKLILLIVGHLIITTAFSQSILKVENDTLMCFTKKQISFIVKDIISKNYNDSLLNETNNQLNLYTISYNTCKITLDTAEIIIKEYQKLVNTYKEDSTVYSKKIQLLQSNNKDFKKIISEKDEIISKTEKKVNRLVIVNKIIIVVSLVFILFVYL